MTILNQNDYERFTWRHRKILLIFGLSMVILRIGTVYFNAKPGIALNDFISILATAGFFFLAELLILQNYKKSIENMENKL
jgi:uncharacterized ion transporter superfamily protein YfcC